MQNGWAESSNGRFRDEHLNANWIVMIADARKKIETLAGRRQQRNGIHPVAQVESR
jgi:hypothetical protein